MNMLRILKKSIFSPLEVMNTVKESGKFKLSILVVLMTALFGSVILPLTYYFVNRNKYDISLSSWGMLVMFTVSVLSWLAACTLFRLFSRWFKKEAGFVEIASTWGLSYVPNFICILLYSLLQLKPEFLTGSGLLGFIVSTVFIMILVWKAIYFFIEMRFVIRTTGVELLIITLATGLIFMLLMWIGFSAGLQVPML